MLFVLACVPFPRPTPLPLAAPAPVEVPVLRLVVAGDAGVEPEDARRGTTGLLPALPAAMAASAASVSAAEVVWLGDNVYEAGVGPGAAGREAAEAVLGPQLAAAPTPAQVSFVPGNHDYLQFAAFRGRLGREAALIEAAGGRARAYGPPVERVAVPGTPFVRLYVDSERAIEDSAVSRLMILTAVTAAVTAGEVPVVLAHHPVADRGPHGQPSPWFFFHTEMAHPQYASFAADLVASLRGAPALLVAGHEHAQGVLAVDGTGGRVVQVVSGSAAKGSLAPPRPDGLDRRPGFTTLDLYGAPARVAITPWSLYDTGADPLPAGVTCVSTAVAGWSVCTAGTAWMRPEPKG